MTIRAGLTVVTGRFVERARLVQLHQLCLISLAIRTPTQPRGFSAHSAFKAEGVAFSCRSRVRLNSGSPRSERLV
jgi:hypothetical protein